MKLPDLKNMDRDDVLGLLGLETKHSAAGQLLAAVGTFGVGLLVGAGVALLLAPKPGRELREQIRARMRTERTGAEAVNGAGAEDPSRVV